jgi:transcription-repair coupling factor (superfamily II helicase)
MPLAFAATEAAAAGRLVDLHKCLSSRAGFGEAVGALQTSVPATFDGVWGSGCALLAAALAEEAPGPLLVVLPRAADLDALRDDLALFSPHAVDLFPAWEAEPDERLARDEIYGDRLRLLKRLAVVGVPALAGNGTRSVPATHPKLLVTSIQALLQPVPSREAVAVNTRYLRVGERIDLDELKHWLVSHKFHPTSAVELPGEFSARGGIIDLFAPDWMQPARLELFGDEVESIRLFDVASQRSLEKLEAVELTMLVPAVSSREHFACFLPSSSWVLLIEPGQIREEGKQYLERVEKPADYHGLDGVEQALARHAVASASALASGDMGVACHLQIDSVERFSGQFSNLRGELDRLGEGHEVIVVSSTDAEWERLEEIVAGMPLAESGRLHHESGRLAHGFRLGPERIIVVSSNELFNRTELRRVPVRRHQGKAIDSFLELREGDLVVHLAHGIGRYRGLKLITKDTQVEEHLEIEFHGGTKIYVPATKIELVQKYVGGTKSRPMLAKIGGKTWLRQKQAAEAAVVDMAAEMLELQAARAARPGIAFSKDTDWQREFDASFPYHETPDQLTALDAIRGDMRRPRPMDRLLCGDVGYGKTEVAMRAAFKAVENGYQVAVLVPTTILAEQHYHTFCERMAGFPFEIAKLSRFCSPREQREVVVGLKKGRVDIVIGTHRLASADVEFYNLGLVIIDEEQRFGVEVKERLKTLRTTVDVLTMTATPIPRTLHMSLVGVRDISNLETPPEDRMAVETRVTRFDDELIRHAVLRELSRGGQIFFVHNRVQDIELLANRLRYMVPEAKIRIGHGQMPELELEQVMVDFVAHKFDLLLATTIVESGLDIPNANTIFIDEADRYGLADLHQLRGRVGRYKHLAYCYLLVEPHKHITPNAAKRLRAIEEFSEMGAGFAIAMRDLEIRGAGNLLGTQQSGHIAAVGYELYCQLLENAVRKLKAMPPKLTIDVDVDLPGEAYLPPTYVSDMRLKIDLYRRLSRVASFDQLDEFRLELIDRFGEPPEPVLRMLALTEVKIDAAVWQIISIHIENQYLVFKYAQRGRIEQLAKLNKGGLRVVDEQSAYLTIPRGSIDPDTILALAKSVLRPR